jgi:hypothetical protein
MISEFAAFRDQLCPLRGTPKWVDVLARLAPATRALVQRLTQPGVTLAQATYPSFGLQPPSSGQDDDATTLAIGEVLMRGALDLATRMAQESIGEAGRGYDLYFRDEFPFASHDTPTTICDWIVEAMQAGDHRLATLVIREAAGCQGLSEPGPALTAQVYRHLGAFKLLGHDIARLRREREGRAVGDVLVSAHD